LPLSSSSMPCRSERLTRSFDGSSVAHGTFGKPEINGVGEGLETSGAAAGATSGVLEGAGVSVAVALGDGKAEGEGVAAGVGYV